MAAAVVNTKKVARLTLHFESLDDVLAEAERLAAASAVGHVQMHGNWSLGQTFVHLAKAMDMAVDGAPFRAPWYVRLVGPWMKNWMLSRPMPPGFKLPKDAMRHLVPSETTPEEGLAELRRAVEHFQAGPRLPKHDILGHMTDDDWLRLHLRHAELHLSFAALKGE